MATPNKTVAGLMTELARTAANQKERDLRTQLVALTGELKKHQDALDAALLLHEHAEYKVTPIKARHNNEESESTAVAVASDWHTEESVDPAGVNFCNEFNLEIAGRRIDSFFGNLLELIRLNRNATRIETLVLPLLGDFITGNIHEELTESNNLSPTEAVLFVLKKIQAGLALIATDLELKSIIIPCCVGNHGRTTPKKRIKTSHLNSFEWLMYHVLAMHVPDERFEYKIANGYHNFVDIYNFKVRFHHGDNIKYDGGIGGPTIPILKAIAGWDKQTRADLDVFGHLHMRMENPKFVLNGSLIGYSDFSVAVKAPFEPPSQTFFLMEKDHGRTVTCPIFLS